MKCFYPIRHWQDDSIINYFSPTFLKSYSINSFRICICWQIAVRLKLWGKCIILISWDCWVMRARWFMHLSLYLYCTQSRRKTRVIIPQANVEDWSFSALIICHGHTAHSFGQMNSLPKRTVRLHTLSYFVSCCFHLTQNCLYQAYLSSLYFPCWCTAIWK